MARARVRDHAGREMRLANWEALKKEHLLLDRALNRMVLGVATRKYGRAVRLHERLGVPPPSSRSRPQPRPADRTDQCCGGPDPSPPSATAQPRKQQGASQLVEWGIPFRMVSFSFLGLQHPELGDFR